MEVHMDNIALGLIVGSVLIIALLFWMGDRMDKNNRSKRGQ